MLRAVHSAEVPTCDDPLVVLAVHVLFVSLTENPACPVLIEVAKYDPDVLFLELDELVL